MSAAAISKPAAFGVGKAAAEDRNSVRNRVPTKGWIGVPDQPWTAGESRVLPEKGFDWPEQTRIWWSHVRVMPHCILWSETDWDFAVTTAFVHAMVWSGDLNKAAELRNRERMMGITEESRRAAHIRYMPPEGDPDTETLSTVRPIPLEIRKPLKGQTKPRLRAIDPEIRK